MNKKAKLLMTMAVLILALALIVSCSGAIHVPDRLNTPAWLNGTWTGTIQGAPIEIRVDNGLLIMTMAGDEQNFTANMKNLSEFLTSFSESSSDSEYSVRYSVTYPEYGYSQRSIMTITKLTDTTANMALMNYSGEVPDATGTVSCTLTKAN